MYLSLGKATPCRLRRVDAQVVSDDNIYLKNLHNMTSLEKDMQYELDHCI